MPYCLFLVSYYSLNIQYIADLFFSRVITKYSTVLARRSSAASNTIEVLKRNSFQIALEPVELEDRWHFTTAARSCAVNMDSWAEIIDRVEQKSIQGNLKEVKMRKSSLLLRYI